MFIIHFLAAFIAVVSFSLNLEIPKKYIFVVGITGAIGWVVYIVCTYFNMTIVLASFMSAFIVAIISVILSKIFKTISTIFFIPGILPIVPGVAMYNMVYSLINNKNDTLYYLVQAILIAGGIALAIFITESINEFKVLSGGKVKNENKT